MKNRRRKPRKLDRTDRFAQLTAVGGDVVGAVTIEAVEGIEA